jgi:hypothetical protein
MTTTKTFASMAAVALLGSSLTAGADENQGRDELRTQSEAESCVAEIAKLADYDGATRVVHRVTELKQKNLVEVELKIDTSIYQDEVSGVTRGYETSCVIAQLGKVVEVRVESVEKEALVSAT